MLKVKFIVILLLSALHFGCATVDDRSKPVHGQGKSPGAVYSPKPKQNQVTTKPYKPPEQITKLPIISDIEPVQTSPAVLALLSDADRIAKSGNLNTASATVERALRIEPRNAALVYKLAELRLKQQKPRLAEDLAKKAILLAANDTALKKRSWLLVSEARMMMGNPQGAAEARNKAAGL